jgi:hypothetical protein
MVIILEEVTKDGTQVVQHHMQIIKQATTVWTQALHMQAILPEIVGKYWQLFHQIGE